MNDYRKLTNEVGAPVADNENSITAGPRGPVMMQDVWLLEKLAHFDREVIPERRMHAKGWGAYGKLTVTRDITKYTRAKVLQPGKVTECFVRFSTVAGERGAADAERDIRGVAMKFYTEDGNWDLVGNNTPTFFLRDVHNFPDLNRAVKRDPYTGMRSAQNTWDFWTLLPETFHQRTIVMSDRGIPDGFRHMNLFGEHTFSFYNEKNERVWCKFHFKTQQGIKNLTNEEAEALNGRDRESAGRDLKDAIDRGDFPKWTMYVQIMTEEQARKHYENPFDITKVWRHAEYPLIEVGELELNRWPENYFAEVEQAAFTPAHVVPGIGFSPDKFLQGRLFVYGDAQRYRLGVNHNLIPVNQAKGVKEGVADYHRSGRAGAAARRRDVALRPEGRPDGRLLPRRRQPLARADRGQKGAAHRQHRRGHRLGDEERAVPPRGALLQGGPGIRRALRAGRRSVDGQSPRAGAARQQRPHRGDSLAGDVSAVPRSVRMHRARRAPAEIRACGDSGRGGRKRQ